MLFLHSTKPFTSGAWQGLELPKGTESSWGRLGQCQTKLGPLLPAWVFRPPSNADVYDLSPTFQTSFRTFRDTRLEARGRRRKMAHAHGLGAPAAAGGAESCWLARKGSSPDAAPTVPSLAARSREHKTHPDKTICPFSSFLFTSCFIFTACPPAPRLPGLRLKTSERKKKAKGVVQTKPRFSAGTPANTVTVLWARCWPSLCAVAWRSLLPRLCFRFWDPAPMSKEGAAAPQLCWPCWGQGCPLGTHKLCAFSSSSLLGLPHARVLGWLLGGVGFLFFFLNEAFSCEVEILFQC